jgi:hypothetical protein
MQQQTRVWADHCRNVAQDLYDQVVQGEIEETEAELVRWARIFTDGGGYIEDFLEGTWSTVLSMATSRAEAYIEDAEAERNASTERWYRVTVRFINREADNFNRLIGREINAHWAGLSQLSNNEAINRLKRQFWRQVFRMRMGTLLIVSEAQIERHVESTLRDDLGIWFGSELAAHQRAQRQVYDTLVDFANSSQGRALGNPTEIWLVNPSGHPWVVDSYDEALSAARSRNRQYQFYRIALAVFAHVRGTEDEARGMSRLEASDGAGGYGILVRYYGEPAASSQIFRLQHLRELPSGDSFELHRLAREAVVPRRPAPRFHNPLLRRGR